MYCKNDQPTLAVCAACFSSELSEQAENELSLTIDGQISLPICSFQTLITF